MNAAGPALRAVRRTRRASARVNRNFLLIIPALTLLVGFFVFPYLYMVYMSFMTQTHKAAYISVFTVANYWQVMSDSFTWRVIWRTLELGVITTLVTLVLAYPMAYQLARASSRVKGFLMILVLSPLLVGVVIRTYAWMIILADTGLVNQAMHGLGLSPLHLMYHNTGIIIGLVHIYIPFMVLSLAGPLQSIDPDVERASRSLGASAWSTFWRVTWPLSMPGVVAGTVLIFVLSASSYVIPQLLGGFKVITVPILVVQTVTELFNWPLGSALALMFFALTLIALWAYLKVMNRVMRGLA